MAKDQAKRSAEASTLMDQIATMMKTKEEMMAKHLETKVALAEKKSHQNENKWEKRCSFEERKLTLEEKRRKDDKIAEENRLMMMDPNGMTPTAREFWR